MHSGGADLLGLARSFTLIFRLIAGQFRRVVPRRVADTVGAAIALLLFWSLATDVFRAGVLPVVDVSFPPSALARSSGS